MPIYEYYCPECNYEKSDMTFYDAIIICPFCSVEMKKKVSLSNFKMEEWNV